MQAASKLRLFDGVIGRWTGDRLVRGVGLLGAGEVAIRLSRILTAIVLARMLGPLDLGIAATAITCFELVRVLANNGLGQAVIRATDADLDAVCRAAYRQVWLVCAGATALQVTAGAVLAELSGRPELFTMIACLAGVYLLMPSGMVQAWLLQREQRQGAIAGLNVLQVGTDNLLTALLALQGFGAWSIVLPKLLTAPIWLLGVRQARPWVQRASADLVPAALMWRFAAPVLASEIVSAIRFNADKLLVAAILGLEALGVYYFAFSAGYGLSLVLTGALSAASFPHLAEAGQSGKALLRRFDQALKRLALPICALIALQALAIIVYVPLLFGDRWTPYVPVVAVLCLSAVTKPCSDLAAQLLRAAGKPGLELGGTLVHTTVLLAMFAAFLPFGLITGVIVLASVTISLQAAFAVWARWLIARTPVPVPTPAVPGAGA